MKKTNCLYCHDPNMSFIGESGECYQIDRSDFWKTSFNYSF